MFAKHKHENLTGAFLWLLVLLAVAAAAWAGFRFHAHTPAREPQHVELTVRYSDVELFAARAGMTVEDTLAFLREQGVTSIGVFEYTLWNLRREPGSYVLSNQELAGELAVNSELARYQDFILGVLGREKLRLGDYVVLMPAGAWAEQVWEHLGQLKEVEDPARFRLTRASSEGMELFLIQGALYDNLPYLALGANPAQLHKISEAGLLVNPYLSARKIETSVSVEQALATYSGAGLSAIVFEGGRVPGFPRFTAETALALEKRGLPAAVYEYHQYPRGMKELALLLDYNLAVMIPGKSGLPTASEIWNGVRERKVQLVELQIRDFAPGLRGEELREGFAREISSLQDLLREKGYNSGGLHPRSVQPLPRGIYLLMGAGLLAFALLFLRLFIPVRSIILLLLFLPGTALIFLLFRWNQILTGQLLSLGTALLFPLYPLLSFFTLSLCRGKATRPGEKGCGNEETLQAPPLFTLQARFIVRAVFLLGVVFLFSLAGGFLLHGFLTQPPFFSGLEFFRGVKIMYAAPLVLAVLAALASCGAAPDCILPEVDTCRRGFRLLPGGELGKPCAVFLRRLLRRPLVVGDVVLLVILLLAVYFYLTRTGHVMEITAAESQARGFLELALGVRPRFKEFLAGYPLTFLGYYLLEKPGKKFRLLSFLLLAAGALAPISVLNTFAHIQAPTVLSLWRSFHGLWLGWLCGLLLLFLWRKGELLLSLARRGLQKDEKRKENGQ